MKNKFKKIIVAFAIPLALACVVEKSFASSITAENLGLLINKERVYNGLQPLKIDPNLNAAANLKSGDMLKRNYFEHFAYGLSPWDFISVSNYNYLYAGENLAMNFDTAEGTVSAWMSSSKHRANILSPDFEDMGLGVAQGTYVVNSEKRDTIMVTNMFGRKKPVILDFFDKIAEQISSIFAK